MLMLLVRLRDEFFAIAAREVVEVVPRVKLREVPGAPAHVSGLLMYRGAIVPVVDLAQLLFDRTSVNALSTRIIVVEYPDQSGKRQTLGLIAEKVTEAIDKDPATFETTTLDLQKTPYLGGVAYHDGDLIQWLNLEYLISDSLRETLLSGQAAMEES